MAITLVLGLAGCDTTKLTADSTAGLFNRAAPAFEQYWDYDVAGKAAPASIIQLEGILRVVPDNEGILFQLLRSYLGYAYGWVEDQAEEAELQGDIEESERLQTRAALLYRRAKDLAQHRLNLQKDGLNDALKLDIESFEAWLEKHCDEKEDAEGLLWLGYAWGSFINMSKDDMEVVADLPYAKALIVRSVELDPAYFNGTGYTFLGVATASELAADMDKAKDYFDKALETTERRSLITQVNMARHYAVKVGDAKLYEELLQEVLDAGDLLPEARLTNRIARRRAERYMRQKGQFF